MMTPQETQALQDFLAQLTQVHGVAKEPQASALIGAAFAQQPDAGYLLVQRALLQDQALTAARGQIAQLQAQRQAEREGSRGGGFLDPGSAWGNSASDGGRSATGGSLPQRFDAPGAPQYAPYVAPPQQYANSAPVSRPGFFGGLGSGGGGSFLGSMAATAAGVAGGAFLFQGIESLLVHHGGASGLLGQNGALPAENTTSNHFYDSGTDGASASSDGTVDDLGSSSDFGNSDDLGSADDMSSI